MVQLVFLILAWTSWLVRTSCFAWLCFLQHLVIQLLGWQPGWIPLRHMHRTFPYSSMKRHRGRRSSKRSLRRKIRRYFKRHAVPFLTHLVLSCAWSLVLRCLSGVTHRCQSWLLFAHGNVSHPARLVPPPLPRCTSRTLPVTFQVDAISWASLPEHRMLHQLLDALRIWTRGLNIPEVRVEAWKRMLIKCRPPTTSKRPCMEALDTLLAVAACVACLLESKAASGSMSKVSMLCATRFQIGFSHLLSAPSGAHH